MAGAKKKRNRQWSKSEVLSNPGELDSDPLCFKLGPALNYQRLRLSKCTFYVVPSNALCHQTVPVKMPHESQLSQTHRLPRSLSRGFVVPFFFRFVAALLFKGFRDYLLAALRREELFQRLGRPGEAPGVSSCLT